MLTIFSRLIEMSRRDPLPLANMMVKLNEESGELAEAVNFHEGYLPNKTMKEPLDGEVADVINCAVAVLVKARGSLSDAELLALLEAALLRKADKWELGIQARLAKPAKA
jgi:NTP pyrophosphatase (non-canonical NTP hydrolase)